MLLVIGLSMVGRGRRDVLQRYVIIVATAFGGAWTMIVGGPGGRGRPRRAGGASRRHVWILYPTTPAPGQRWVPIAWIVLGLVGTAVQLGITGKKTNLNRHQSIGNLQSAIMQFRRMRMATFERHVDVDWKGSVMEGKGEAKAGSGAFTLPVTFPTRIGEPGGKTSPEELMAAAHAACYAMALNGTLGRKQASADRTVVRATVTADKGDAGIKIVSSKLTVTAYGLKGLDASQFAEVAKEAEGRCPVSNAYRGTMQITVDAKVG